MPCAPNSTLRSPPPPSTRTVNPQPEYLVMGMSAETFYGGWEGNIEFRQHIEDRTNLRVATGAEACKYALEKFGAKRIACVTPYMPVMGQPSQTCAP